MVISFILIDPHGLIALFVSIYCDRTIYSGANCCHEKMQHMFMEMQIYTIYTIYSILHIVFKCKHKPWFIADFYIVVTLHGYQSILSLSISKNKNNHDDHKCIHMNLCYLYLYKHAPNILHSNQP